MTGVQTCALPISETYEVAFCEHHHVCTIFHQCHTNEAVVFNELRADVEAEMDLTVQEFISVEQSRCLTGLIMEAMTPPRTPISHAALIACDDVDVSALNINFPDLPSEPAACPAHTHGDPQCEGSAPPVAGHYSESHVGQYLSGHAAGDSTIRPISEAQDACNQLGDQCADRKSVV